ncbi:rRNA 2'-O-methyltransferase fibrillarin [Drosophila eugracilis]|uniref:rRNA 2'-O-methyltransferase fibrillarin n=1 Tax=Drosophila eugracilis TaxID=29029 RepID=UPI001BD99231|nr:rRNA 2'-O-methyltransferase fibrillarin [Drosophila eugracilis]
MSKKSKRQARSKKPRSGGGNGRSSHAEPSKNTSKNSVEKAKNTSAKSPIQSSIKQPKNLEADISKGIESEDEEQLQTDWDNETKYQDEIQVQEVKLESQIYENVENSYRIESHRHFGVFLSRNRFDAILLLTRNISTNTDDYGEHRIKSDFRGKRSEFRAWSPFQSKLAAGIMSGASDLHLRSGSKVLYLGAGFGRSVSHISDIVGESGMVYAVEQGPWAGRQLTTLANGRLNIVPVIDDATMPYKYRFEVPACIDVIISDLPQADQARSLMLNARHYLVSGGNFLTFMHSVAGSNGMSNKEAVAAERELLKKNHLEPTEMISLEPFKPGYSLVMGVYTRKDEAA